MNIKQIIDELKKLGMDVKYRKRTDGGYLIQQINNMTFTGSKGNAYARSILGVELSQARIEQTSFNVNKYISHQKKKATLKPELKAKLRKVQREWRKEGVQAKITAKKVKWHVKESGEKSAKDYLEKMSRYGQGYAYMENVEYLASYTEDIARGMLTNDDLQNELYELASLIRSKAETFKEEWVNKVYRALYQILEHNYNERAVRSSIDIIKHIIS